MDTTTESKKYNVIPTQLTEEQFYEFIFSQLSEGKRGPKPKIGYFKIFNYILYFLHTGVQWHKLPIEKNDEGKPEIHYTRIFKIYSRWVNDGSFEGVFEFSVIKLNENDKLDLSVIHGDGSDTVAKKGGDNIGYSGHKHHKGEEVIAIVDRNVNVISPLPTAPANQNECVLLPEAIDHLMKISEMADFSLKGTIFSLDAAYDSASNRKLIFNRGMTPNIKENKRNRKKTKRGRKRLFSEEIYQERFRKVERLFAWEDKFKRLLLRFERLSKNHLGLKLIAFTMINLRHFCQALSFI